MKVLLKNVRLSFPDLFQPSAFGDGEPKFGATFLIDKNDKATVDMLRAAALTVATDTWPKGVPKGVKYCIRDGSEKEYDGYDNTLYIRASCKKRPPVINRDKSPIVEQDNAIYAGCYVNAAIELWGQDNKWGQRVNAQLLGVQFYGEGDPF